MDPAPPKAGLGGLMAPPAGPPQPLFLDWALEAPSHVGDVAFKGKIGRLIDFLTASP